MRLLIATTNPGKLREIRRILAGLPVDVAGIDSVGPVAEPEECGRTFEENARVKARYYATVTGETAVAEDSGLEIDVLDGAPGVYSARFGLPGAVTYPDKFALLYRALRERGHDSSPARFVCALALATGNRIDFETRGTVEGVIASSPRGAGGFGYDPILYYPPLGRTLAELTADEKAAVSHRGQACRALRQYLERRLPSA
ncbi:MAG: RdgB/HAM1 family non-canonical purine NTP pyrophosphatase [Acidobacteria bacterium]|nr:RdgB/HAM1 family non-canonical purine NTP pyrophosphatase [Acidobacteriota bacterium]